jgi:uncharacterized membrane protein YfcA
MDPVFVQIIVVAAVAGFVQGLSGFAFALVAVPLWAWTIEPQLLVPTVVVTAFLGQVISLLNLRKEVKLARATPFLIGGYVGVPLGVLILPTLNVAIFQLCVGVTLVIYSSVMLRLKFLPMIRRGGKIADGFVGLVAGTMGSATGMPGPPIVLWCASRGWDKETQRSTFQSFFVGTQILTIAIFIASGLINARSMQLVLVAALPVILSSWLGAQVFKKLKDKNFQNIIFGLLLLSGVNLVLKAL